jgi:hypothetical protein
MKRKTEMTIFEAYAIIWKYFIFHLIALICIFKCNIILGLVMVVGIILHNVFTLIVYRGMKMKTTLERK